jgi:hypothetical protein
MSASLSAAKKRRAPPATAVDVSRPGGNNPSSQTQPGQQGLTLPQVISLIDKRLIHLESLTKNIQTNMQQNGNHVDAAVGTGVAVDKEEIVQSVTEDFNSKFDVMAEEIADLKNIVMSLQAYTMDVNKMLLQQLQSAGVVTFQLSNDPTISAIEESEAP